MADDHKNPDKDPVMDAMMDAIADEADRVRDDVTTHFDLGVAYTEMGLFADAVSEFEIVLRRDPGHARAKAELAAVNARMGNPPKPIGSA